MNQPNPSLLDRSPLRPSRSAARRALRLAGLAALAALSVLGAAFFGGTPASAAGEDFRHYEPIEAKAARIVRGEEVAAAPGRAGAAAEHRRRGWSHFDRGDWMRANDAFLSAIEQDPGDLESAEGLAMSVYRSGDYRAAYRLGRELAVLMPSVSRLVSGTVEADARGLVGSGNLAGARELLRHFPATEEVYARLHRMVSDADALGTGVERSGESGENAREAG